MEEIDYAIYNNNNDNKNDWNYYLKISRKI